MRLTTAFLILVCANIRADAPDDSGAHLRLRSIRPAQFTFSWSDRHAGDRVGNWEISSITNGMITLQNQEDTIRFTLPEDYPTPPLIAVISDPQHTAFVTVCRGQQFKAGNTHYSVTGIDADSVTLSTTGTTNLLVLRHQDGK